MSFDPEEVGRYSFEDNCAGCCGCGVSETANGEYVDVEVIAPLLQCQFDALVDFVYNLGPGALRESKLLRKLNVGDYEGAAAEFPRWNKAGGKVMAGLKARRLAEQKMFMGEDWR